MATSPIEDQILRNAVDVNGVGNGLGRSLVFELDKARKRIAERIGKTKGEFTKAHLERIEREIDLQMERLELTYNRTINGARRVVVQEAFTSVGAALAREVGQDAGVVQRIATERVEVLLRRPVAGHITSTWTRFHIDALGRQLKSETAGALIEGIGPAALARRLRGGDKVDLRKRIQGAFGLSRNSAMSIARTSLLQSNADANDEVFKENESLIESYTYLSVLDNRTCVICGPYDGVTADKKNDLPAVPQHLNCVLPGNLVIAPDAKAGFSALYDGVAVELRLRSGKRLTVTANHPLLTDRGFASANLLREGDNLVDASLLNHAADYPDADCSPALIEQVIESLSMACGVSPVRMPVTAEDFHGDAVGFEDGKVDIVGADAELGSYGDPSVLKSFSYSGLDGSHLSGFLAGHSTALARLNAAFGASHCGVCGLRQSHPFFRARALHPLDHAVASAASFTAGFGDDADDGHSGYAETVRDGLDGLAGVESSQRRDLIEDGASFQYGPSFSCLACGSPLDSCDSEPLKDSGPGHSDAGGNFIGSFPGGIPTDQIVSINVFSFCGHVYDLQTDSGLYDLEGIISSNCRCVHSPNTMFTGPVTRPAVTESETRTIKHRDGSTSSKTTVLASRRTTQNYEQFFKSQPKAWQRMTLGPARFDRWVSGKSQLADFAKGNQILNLKQLRGSARTAGTRAVARIDKSGRPPRMSVSRRNQPPEGKRQAIKIGVKPKKR